MKLLEKTTSCFYALIVLILGSLLFFYFFNSVSVRKSGDWIQHTQEVIIESNLVILNIIDIETAVRGYILTGDQTFLEPYNLSKKTAIKNLLQLQTLCKDNLKQTIRVEYLKKKIEEKLKLNSQFIALEQNKNGSNHQKEFDFEKGKKITNSIRFIISKINETEKIVLRKRKLENADFFKTSENLLILLFTLVVIISVFIYFIFKKNKNRGEELIAANKEILFHNDEKQNREHELSIANIELEIQKNMAQQQIYSRSLIEASIDPLFTISLEGKITDINKASVEVTGTTHQKLIGSSFFEYFTEPKKARESYEKIFKDGFVINYPLTIKDHKLTDVLFNGSIYKDSNGVIIGAVVVARDITQQKALEKELTEAKNFAEKATTVANESVKSKQLFLSNMSHEIRTPMNAIIGFTKVVLKTELTAKQKEYITAIKMSGDALIVLINDILDLAKVDAGKMTFEKIPFKLSLSIKAMLHIFESKIQEKNLQLILNYDENIPEVLVGDPVRLHQIILNLVSNAVKFTHEGKITVSLSLIHETKEKTTVKFSIADTGIGIKPNKTAEIFENFQQATSKTSRLFGGTGLGLAIVKQLIEAQNGTIEVTSELNKGSTFDFNLDFQKTNAQAVLEPEIVELNTDLKDIKILVVEDMELNQLLMKTLLDDFGFECEIALNGKITVEKLKIKTFDIVLMDLQMPEMNGFEATNYIRKKLKLDIPIIALTADVTTVDVDKCKEVGMNDYISKPIDERLLYSKLISFIKKPVLIIEEKIEGNLKIEKIKYVDMSHLLKLTKSNPKLMSEMINVYLTQTPSLVQTIKKSYLDKDWQLLRATMHKITPSLTIMGLGPEIIQTAKKINELAHHIELTADLDSLIQELEKVCNLSFIELKIELTKLKL